jgi:hypothetical protein
MPSKIYQPLAASPRAKQQARSGSYNVFSSTSRAKSRLFANRLQESLIFKFLSVRKDIRLYESNGEAVKYCTLSHCRGTAPVIKLTENVLARYKKRI